MLRSITWVQFGTAVGSAGLLYYLFVLFKYYRLEIAALFAGPKEPPPAPGNDHQIFGASLTDDAEMNLVSADELFFAEDETVLPVKDQLLGDMADFMQELKVLLRITKEAEDTKENFFTLLQLLVGKHPAAASIRYAEPIALYLLEEGADLPFTLSKHEIENALIPDDHEN